ncbi:DUF4389 domain-containing protein [Amycolatopsis alba]|uniref:DUF4389 domain-containing protein n=1 Tax=Amycolatopsis alba DSM 44262 TaxID=1125972 RepID=A0A229RG17_AMYAL|nr:DUF4389 domain-containing protein [Amycolatopsis alba]OXM45429.1 DUF4389 domain-containing protein [Amycolatopsis alba DSM 44262]
MSSSVRVETTLDPGLSRWLWLVKWLLAIPHYLVLAVLWLAFVPLTMVAFFAILFTGRYPRSIFEFNVGVFRWAWRVHYYAYAALGTDRYPPFTLADDPSYPARLEIDYPERLSRGSVLVKWWLLAIPHYLVLGVFAGGGLWLGWGPSDDRYSWGAGGLIGILVLIAAIILLFTGKYPKPLYDFVIGMDRWVIRVGAYAALMTDEYPPFRLDMGGTEPGRTSISPETPAPSRSGAHWSPGRIVSVVAGVLLGALSMGLLTGGVTLLWLDKGERSDDGYLSASSTYSTGTHALTSERVHFAGTPDDVLLAERALGDLRIRVTDLGSENPIFVGIAPSSEVARYLEGTEYVTITDLASGAVAVHQGSGVPLLPENAGVWTVSSAGAGTRTVEWPDQAGDWTVVVMNADGSPGVNVRAEAGATAPVLGRLAWVFLTAGIVALAAAVVLVALSVSRASRELSATRQGES